MVSGQMVDWIDNKVVVAPFITVNGRGLVRRSVCYSFEDKNASGRSGEWHVPDRGPLSTKSSAHCHKHKTNSARYAVLSYSEY